MFGGKFYLFKKTKLEAQAFLFICPEQASGLLWRIKKEKSEKCSEERSWAQKGGGRI